VKPSSEFGERASRACHPRHGHEDCWVDAANADGTEVARLRELCCAARHRWRSYPGGWSNLDEASHPFAEAARRRGL